MSRPNDLMQTREFIVQSIEHAGGAVEERMPGLLDAMLPSLMTEDGADSLQTLALDTDALNLEPAAQLATVGSSFLELLISFGCVHGTTTVGRLEVDRVREKGLREAVEGALLFSNCRVRYPSAPPQIRDAWYAVFNFTATFLSDEKRERRYVVPVNLWSNQLSMQLAERMPHLPILPAWTGRRRNAEKMPLDGAYEVACRAVKEFAAREAEQYQTRVRKRFDIEFARMSGYYEQVAGELRQRQERETDEERIETLEQRIGATLAEREGKLRDLGEKYHLRVRARLTSGCLLSQPKSFFKLFVDRKAKTRALTLVYDSLLERLELPVCEACHRETSHVHVSTECEFLCRSCASLKRPTGGAPPPRR